MNNYLAPLKNLVVSTLGCAVLACTAAASPIPGSSQMVAPHLGLYRSPLGFEITNGGSGWAHSEPPKDNKFVATVYDGPSDASLTVRVDRLQKEVPLEKYVQRWLKEYPRYGFDVIGSKPFMQNKDRAYFFDLVNHDTGKQLRQVVFLKDQRAVILTCRDKVASFSDSLKSCNQIIRSFHWME